MGAKRKFDDNQIREIRACTLTRKQTAALYSTTCRTIDNIKAGNIYTDVSGPAAVPCGCGRVASPDRKMDADMVRRIRANVDGLTFEKLGKIANVSTHAAYEAYHGFTYKEVQ